MKRFSAFFLWLAILSLAAGCGMKSSIGSSSSADWAYSFVVWDNDIYAISDVRINIDAIEKEIGEVKKYSDVEGTYGNGFSNKYPVGTKLFKVKNMNASNYIAIEAEENVFLKAENKGKYGGKSR